MAKSVSGKLVLISNLSILILGIILILIIVGTLPPPSSSSEEQTSNENSDVKYIIIKANDIYAYGRESNDNKIIEISIYKGPEENFSKLRQRFTIVQEQTVVNVYVQRGDLITVVFFVDEMKENELVYHTTDTFDSIGTLNITWNGILNNNEYLSRKNLSFLVLNQVDVTPLTTSTIEIDTMVEKSTTFGLVDSDNMYVTTPATAVSSGLGKTYHFTGIPYGVGLNSMLKTNDTNPITISSLSTNRIVVTRDTDDRDIIQSCCGSVACTDGFAGEGSYANIDNITADDLCNAANKIKF